MKTFTEFLRVHYRARWVKGRNGSSPPPFIHPPRDFSKSKKGVWRRGLKDLMGWITKGRDHVYGGLLSGGFLQEGEGKTEEEAVQMEQRKEEMWTTVMESMEIGWTFLQGIGVPVGSFHLGIVTQIGKVLSNSLRVWNVRGCIVVVDGH